MKRAIFAALAALMLAVAGPAFADSHCDKKTQACEDAAEWTGKAPYKGVKAPTTEEMVCLHVIAESPTELILAEGEVEYAQPVDGDVLTRWRPDPGAWRPWSRDSSIVVREICFPRRYLREGSRADGSFRSALTLCNGAEVGEGNRSVWRERKGHLSYLAKKKRIGEADPACLLGDEENECPKYGL